MTAPYSPDWRPPAIQIQMRDVRPGMTVFVRSGANDVTRIRCTSTTVASIVSHDVSYPKSHELVTVLSINTPPSPLLATPPVESETLEIGDWFDPFSRWGWGSRRVIARRSDDLLCRGISTSNPNFDTITDISMHREFGLVYRVPGPRMLDPDLRTVVLGSNVWTLLLTDNWWELAKVVERQFSKPKGTT